MSPHTAPAPLPKAAAPHPPRTPDLDVQALARRLLDLPPLPTALAEAMRVLSHDEVPAQACVRAIEREPVLALRVLQLANSGFYAVPTRVVNLGDAVRLLGLRAVAAVVSAVSIKQMMGRLPGNLLAQPQRWRHALATGCAARELALLRGLDADEAFVAGLLHDVGGWLLAAFAPQEAAAVRGLQQAAELDLCSAEQQVLGITHEQLGAQVARQWRFPREMMAAIAHHHAPRSVAAGGTALERLVHVAQALVHEFDAEPLPDALDADAWNEMALDQAQLALLRERTLAALASLEQA